MAEATDTKPEPALIAHDSREAAQSDLFKDLREQTQNSIAAAHSRLIGWLVAGNVAGLYFVLDRAASKLLPDNLIFGSLYSVFLIGAAAGVLGLVGTLILGTQLQQILRNMAVAKEDVKINLAALSPYATLVRKMRSVEQMIRVFGIFPAISGMLLLIGIASPLWLFKGAWDSSYSAATGDGGLPAAPPGPTVPAGQ